MEPERKPKRGERGAASDEFFPAAPHERQCSRPRELWDVLESGSARGPNRCSWGSPQPATTAHPSSVTSSARARKARTGGSVPVDRASRRLRGRLPRPEDVARARRRACVPLDPLDPWTARHAPQCEFAAESDPSTLRVLLKVTERDGYWWSSAARASTAGRFRTTPSRRWASGGGVRAFQSV